MIDKLHQLSVCISYDQVLTISTALGNSVCELFQKEGIVCPPKLKKDVFTTACVDNIDHKPSSRTSKDSFHGTVISVTQHRRSSTAGIDRDTIVVNNVQSKNKTLLQFPDAYTEIYPTVLKKGDIYVPKIGQSFANDSIVGH